MPRWISCKHLINYASYTPNIMDTFRGHYVTFHQNFWSGPVSLKLISYNLPITFGFNQTEISYLTESILPDENVYSLQIAVNQSIFVQIFEPMQYIKCYVSNHALLRPEVLFLDKMPQSNCRNIFLYNFDAVFLFLNSKIIYKIFMSKFTELLYDAAQIIHGFLLFCNIEAVHFLQRNFLDDQFSRVTFYRRIAVEVYATKRTLTILCYGIRLRIELKIQFRIIITVFVLQHTFGSNFAMASLFRILVD